MSPCRRSLSDDDVQLVILERGVKLLFEHRLQAMDLVQKENLPLAQIREDGCEIALNLQRGPGRLLKSDVQLVRNDRRERGLAQARRPEQQHVVERFATGLRGLKRNSQLLLRFGLADELG